MSHELRPADLGTPGVVFQIGVAPVRIDVLTSIDGVTFAEAWPERADYKKPWKSWPREIPDDFVREFGEWCAGHGVRSAASIRGNL